MTEAVEEEEEICNEASSWSKQNKEGKFAERITDDSIEKELIQKDNEQTNVTQESQRKLSRKKNLNILNLITGWTKN